MVDKLKITDSGGTNIHWDGHSEFTLCGLEALDGDPAIGLEAPIIVKSKVDCGECLNIIKQVKKILKKYNGRTQGLAD